MSSCVFQYEKVLRFVLENIIFEVECWTSEVYMFMWLEGLKVYVIICLECIIFELEYSAFGELTGVFSFTILNWKTKFLRCYHKSWHYNYYFTSIKFLSLYISRVIHCWPFTIVWYEVLFLTGCLLVFNNECPICWLCDFESIRNI